MITVATDSGGAAAAEEWIRAAGTTHPALIDERHLVARLYGMVNVPNAVWIDEQGWIVRPAESAGSVDEFRAADRESLTLTDDRVAAIQRAQEQYLTAIRAWVRTGRYALSPAEAQRRLHEPDPVAATHFQLGEYLHRRGDDEPAQRHFLEAVRLDPDNWNYRRQALALADTDPGEPTPMSALGRSGADFWAAVDALGDRRFYPAIRLEDDAEHAKSS